MDSASLTTDEFYRCVVDNFGEPQIWGRYMVDKEGVSYGLTDEEITLLHNNNIMILPIYNHFEDATTYKNGVAQAEQAIQFAKEYGIPEGVALFADIEPMYPVDTAFIQGWHDTIMASSYESGIYGVFSDDSELNTAFVQATEENEEIIENTVIWSNQPQIGITTKSNAPEYDVSAPEGSLDWGWQYGLDSETCNIDTNWFRGEITDYLW
ncbi:glycoside hydrolase domain-containing protein [Anaerobacillus sp. MEB173]|uniref:glycoside hydrolase domain-containing protein n=1 Tax=Anaerobacillus sp. MEB173 TaxID=3383345 RepID=UPI003F8E3938